jgi:predicted lipid carrier protein YhbT
MGGSVPDPQSALDRIKRAISGAPTQIAETLAGSVQSASPQRLEQLMRTPARRLVLDAIFWQMPQFVDRRQSRRLNASVRWAITGRADGGADLYDLVFTDGRCRVIRGGGTSEPPVTIRVDGVEFLRLAAGSSDPMRAYFKGRLAITGDIMVAAKLVSLFRIPRARGRTGHRPGERSNS